MSIRTLIEDKARELAGEAEVGFMHLHAAASQLTADIRRELDSLIVELRPAGSAVPITPAVIAPPEPEAAAAEPASAAPEGSAVPAEPAQDPAS